MNHLISFFILLLALFAPLPAQALATDWQSAEGVTVRLITAHDKAGAKEPLLMGLDVQLQNDWHTYWRSPGDAGTPPILKIDGSTNIQKIDLLYPTPRRYSLMGIDTIGYSGNVVFPLRVTRQDADEDATLKASVDLLICGTLCVPQHFDFTLTLPAGRAKDSAEKPLIDAALAKLPANKNTPHLSLLDTQIGIDTVTVKIKTENGATDPDLFIESKDNLAFSKPEVSAPSDTLTLTAKLLSTLPEGKPLAATPLTITIVNGDTALENTKNPEPVISAPAPHPSTKATPPLPLWIILLLALLGGFILNLMPCVLPVLSLKILSVMKHAGGEKRAIRHSFLSSAGGIVFSFLLLALATIGLKLSGQAFGWGVQFQQPVFLVFMIALLTFFAANLWDFFDVGLPRFLMNSLDASHHPKLAGDFATGMLATLLATPCSAPFLGTAIGFALAAGAFEIILVFLALGIGMALPYLSIAQWPHLANKLPKAGSWMMILKHILGYGMGGTAVWLLLVISAQVGRQLTMVIAAAMIAILIALYLRHKRVLRWLVIPTILAALAGSFFIALAASVPESLAKESGVWERFEERKIPAALAQGKIVFVDVTADWCITCKFNKRFILSQDDVSARLFDKNKVVALQADWTNPDPAITAFLQKYGNYGVPFNIVFGPQAPQGIPLPELLTSSAVLDALEKAK